MFQVTCYFTDFSVIGREGSEHIFIQVSLYCGKNQDYAALQMSQLLRRITGRELIHPKSRWDLSRIFSPISSKIEK